MSSSGVASDTLVRKLSRSTLRELSDFLDPQDAWKSVLVDIKKDTGEPRYTQLHVRRFERLVAQGKSPTVELLYDWGTTNCTVGELVEILIKHKLFAPARVLLPDITTAPVETYWRSVEDPPTQYHQEQTQVCAVKLNQAKLKEESPCMLPDSTTGPEESQEPPEDGFYSFTYRELTQITGNWDERPASIGGNRLGEGGFGIVFKGQHNIKPVAVKKLNLVDDLSPEELKSQFRQEIQTLKRTEAVLCPGS